MKKKETTFSVLKDIRALLKSNNTFLAQMAIKKPTEQNIAKQLGVNTNEKYFKIIDGPGKKTSDLMNEMRSKFKVWSYCDDETLDKDFPAPKEQTIRYFKKTVEPDEDLRNKSAEDLQKEGVVGITLRERLIMELQYFSETGKHLDVNDITLCSGSRYAGGPVPSVHRVGGGEVDVRWYYPQYRDSDLRARRAVNPSDL